MYFTKYYLFSNLDYLSSIIICNNNYRNNSIGITISYCKYQISSLESE